MIRGESKELVDEVDEILSRDRVYNHDILDNTRTKFYFAMYREEENYRLHVSLVVKDTMSVFHKLVAKSIWLGSGKYNNTKYIDFDPYICNTVLFVNDRSCTWLGESCCSFELEKGEEVVRYVSTVCNEWTAYGWIETNTSYLGLYQFSCDTYRITKTPQVNQWIKSEKLLLASPNLDDQDIRSLIQPLKVSLIPHVITKPFLWI